MSDNKVNVGAKSDAEVVVIILFGSIASLMFFYAGDALATEAKDLMELRSVGGKSVAESYYQSMGGYGYAYSWVCWGLSVVTMALTVGLARLVAIAKQSVALSAASLAPAVSPYAASPSVSSLGDSRSKPPSPIGSPDRGAPFPPDRRTDLSGGGAKTCSTCGKQVSANTVYCDTCGSTVGR